MRNVSVIKSNHKSQSTKVDRCYENAHSLAVVACPTVSNSYHTVMSKIILISVTTRFVGLPSSKQRCTIKFM